MFDLYTFYKYRVLPHGLRRKLFRKVILSYYDSLPVDSLSSEYEEAIKYLRSHPITTFLSSFTEKYNAKDIQVFTDNDSQLKYVLHEGKKLYFKRKWSVKRIQRAYNALLEEQDIASPHRYTEGNFNVLDNDVLLDIGAAEGNFSLSVIEKVQHVYLFETDEEWIEAMKKTFEPWKNKVSIINKFVGNKDTDTCITLDSFFPNKSSVNFIKADVEGAERDLLYGAKRLITENKYLKIALCAYHRQDDEMVLSNILQEHGFNISFSKGYMIYTHNHDMCPPYLRRGLIRSFK